MKCVQKAGVTLLALAISGSVIAQAQRVFTGSCPPSGYQPSSIINNAIFNPAPNLTTVVAHRGYWRSTGSPENSVQAFDDAANLGVEAVEIDVRLTNDGEPVAMHDWALGRTTTGTGDVYSTPLASYEANYMKDRTGTATSIPATTLVQLFDAVMAHRIVLMLDLKNQGSYPGQAFSSYDTLVQVIAREVEYEQSHNLAAGALTGRIVHKVLWKELPSPQQLDNQTWYPAGIPNYFYLIGVLYPDGSSPNQDYLNQPWFRTEPSVPYPGATLEQFKNDQIDKDGHGASAFVEVYDHPEGTSQAIGYLKTTPTNTRPSSNPSSDNPDYRSDLSFTVGYMRSTVVVTDRPEDAISFLSGIQQRNTAPYCTTYTPQSGGTSSASTSGSGPATGGADVGTPPTTPSSLSASANSPTTASLTWNSSSAPDQIYYTVYRSTTSPVVQGLATLIQGNLTATTFTDSSLSPNTTYYYAVVAGNSAGESPLSSNATTTTPAASACHVAIGVQNDWGSGYQGSVSITNNGASPIQGWSLTWNYSGNQQVIQSWGSTYSQSGAAVTLNSQNYTATIQPGSTVSNIGFNANYSGTNTQPTSFILNGSQCN